MSGTASLTGIALVTGAATGIGKEACFQFAEAGCLGVAFADCNYEEAVAAAKESHAYSTNKAYRTVALRVDVADSKSVQKMVDDVINEFGRIDYNVNAAGVANTTLQPTAQCSLEELNQNIDVNLKGMAFCIRAVLGVMTKQQPLMYLPTNSRTKDSPPRSLGRGAIVNLGSANSYMAQYATFAYTAAKHGVIGLTKAAALGHAKDGIRINAVCPGPVDTPIMHRAIARTPIISETIKRGVPLGGRMAEVDEIANVVLFLCGPGASYIKGSDMVVDAGVTLTAARL